MSDVNEPGKPLYLGEDAERELLIERFEEAWQSGDPPSLAEFVAEAPHPNPKGRGDRIGRRSSSWFTLTWNAD